ncbi:hypothetical protein AGLY_018304 [Aphis glycines]|uniref:Envelope fusion protein n=1 Tax=Aphis glycines TaxID=307491 RepID=A0A6G0ST61_APHGL|nr:hypothetical protein AGLY_018304 [Aphis glycines]
MTHGVALQMRRKFGNLAQLQPLINHLDSDNYHQVYNLTLFKNQQGIYYESHGVARLSHDSWELVISLNVQSLISKYHVIMDHYEATTTICKKLLNKFGNVEIEEICSLFMQQFSRATLPYLNEIEANHRSLMLAIDNDGNRVQRGLGQAFRRMANVLYGVCSKINVEFILNQISELNRSKGPSISNISEKTRFLQAEANSTQQLELQQQKLEQNLHVFTPQRIIKELLEIKVDLPIGNTFPLDINTESLNDILRISEKTIFFKDSYLIYVIEIPLISSEEYSIYHPIPLPIPHSKQAIFLVDPEIDYLGVSRDNENFIALDNGKWEECITLKPYKVLEVIIISNIVQEQKNSILFSNNKASRDMDSDIIPENSRNELLHALSDRVTTIIPQNLPNKILIRNLNQLTNNAVELNELSHTLAEPFLIFNIKVYIIIVIFIMLTLTILTTSILSFRLRKKVIKIYNPEIPEAEQSNGIQEDTKV